MIDPCLVIDMTSSPDFAPRSIAVGLIAVCLLLTLAAPNQALSQSSRPRVTENMGAGRWEVDEEFPEDSLTFVRLKHGGRKWETDFPGAEENFTTRLHQLTSIQVNPVFKVLEIDDEELFRYPFAFMSNMDRIEFSRAEAENLRKYLTNGGFVMVDDLWGDSMWEDIESAMQDVFPEKEPMELDIQHPIFRAVFKLDYLPQVPSHNAAEYWNDRNIDNHYETELRGNPDPDELDEPHFRAWFDDSGRMMMLVCHNNDLADGWEEEDFNPWFFKKYAEKLCFPMGINIIFYALTN